MTGTPNSSSASPTGPARVQTKISVSDPKIMVNLLGAKDEILRLIERTLASDVHVRGNEITITGDPAENATAERLFSELIELIEKGETLTVDSVRRTASTDSVSPFSISSRSSEKRRSAVALSAGAPVIVISLPRTWTSLTRVRSMSRRISSLGPSRFTMILGSETEILVCTRAAALL
jgi:phosphate starvation-inducible protein PhoH